MRVTVGFHSRDSDVQQVLPEESSCVSHKGRPKKKKQTPKRQESGAEKGLLQGQARKWVTCAQEKP